jgi:hypothetical protein
MAKKLTGANSGQFPYFPPPPNPGNIQSQLEAETGLDLGGALGGLPVVEQTQEYFAVFDEAGDASPELIDKTQFRITYLVDSELGTSKPSVDSISALNVTQNFGKVKTAIIRADNATVLNQNLSGEQTIYDIGTLTLISTTETGSSPSAYTSTASFSNTQGQDIITDAENLTGDFSASFTDNPDLEIPYSINSGGTDVLFPAEVIPISQSNGLYEWIGFDDNTTFKLKNSTYNAGTRLRFSATVYLKVPDETTISSNYQYFNGSVRMLLNGNPIRTTNFTLTNTQWNGILVETEFDHWDLDDEIKINVRRTNGGAGDGTLKIVNGRFRSIQEYTPGDVLLEGINATFSPYFEPYYSSNTGSILNNQGGFSILTASAQLSTFAQGGFTFRLHPDAASWDPTETDSTFNPITTPFTFEVGDEMRFEYNKNKVHKIIETAVGNDGRYYVTLSPYITSQSVVDHFTHYRIVENGGYLIANIEKNNEVNEFQPFSGIILPQYPSENLQKRGDRLIYELKQANIIEK